MVQACHGDKERDRDRERERKSCLPRSRDRDEDYEGFASCMNAMAHGTHGNESCHAEHASKVVVGETKTCD